MAGGTSAAVNLAVLYVFNSIWGIYYLTASIGAFVVAFFVSLFSHKYWTFQDFNHGSIHIQASKYLASSLFGLLLNTVFLYFFVDFVHVPVLVGQIFAGGMVACITYFISHNYIFNVLP